MSKYQFIKKVAVISLFITLSWGKSTANFAAVCIDESGVTHSNGETYGKPGVCETFYTCDNGKEVPTDCPPGTAFDPKAKKCDHIRNVVECRHIDGISCSDVYCIDENGVFTDTKYVDPATCEQYECIDGFAYKHHCLATEALNPETEECQSQDKFPTCIPNEETTCPGADLPTTIPASSMITLSTTEPTKDEPDSSSSTPDSHSTPPKSLDCTDVYCTDENGKFTNTFYVNPTTCKSYQCANGISYDFTCSDPALALNPETGTCDWQYNFPVCVPDSEASCSNDDPTTTAVSSTLSFTVSSTKTPSATNSVSSTKTPSATDSDSSTKTPSATDSVSSTKTPSATDSSSATSSSSNQDSTTQSTTTTTPITTTTVKTGEKYVVFVVDDTGSMSNEIEGVKEWITNCVDGSYASCADSPSGGWVLSTFNDPSIGTAIGPEKDVSVIIDAVGRLNAYGGMDCPERALAGVQEALSVIPDDSASCKLFFFTDALMNDEHLFGNTQQMLITKGCTFIPTLTGCCGPCEDPCPSVDPDYCTDHIHDSTTSSRRKRSISDPAAFTTPLEQKYYSMASKTGGDIYITEKPRSSDDFLEFLEEELTLGFCPTDLIAGPPPYGYTTEQDCNITNSCWDRSVGKCYCMSETEPCPTHTIFHCPTDLIAGPSPNGYETEIDCNITNSCWDRRVGKCYCMSETEPCPKEPVIHCPTEKIAGPPPNGYEIESDCNITKSCWDSRFERCYCNSETEPCPNVPVIPICRPQDGYFFSADITDCNMYYECNQGTLWKRPCAPGTVFDAETLRCDHLHNVKAPCGTLAS